MRIARAAYDEMKRHTFDDAPRECVGLLIGPDADTAVEAWRCENVAKSPTQGFVVAATEKVALIREALDRQRQVVAVYHSHPASDAAPSKLDVESAWPHVVMVIIGMGHGLQVRGWKVTAGVPFSEPLEVV